MNHQLSINYRNVTLRPLLEKDLESLRIWRNNPDNSRYLRRIPYISPQMQKQWFQKYLQEEGEFFFAIVENSLFKRLVGSLSLYDFSEDTCSFGKILIGDEEAHGHSVGVNATIAALQIAFEQIGVNEVKLFVYACNDRAISVYKKAGFSVFETHKDSDGNIEYTMIKTKGCSGS